MDRGEQLPVFKRKQRWRVWVREDSRDDAFLLATSISGVDFAIGEKRKESIISPTHEGEYADEFFVIGEFINGDELVSSLKSTIGPGVAVDMDWEEVEVAQIASTVKTARWSSVVINLVLEGISALLDQLGYPLPGMLIALLALILTVYEFFCKKFRVTLDGSFIDLFGVAAALWQFVYSTVEYKFTRQHSNNPIKTELLPFLFASLFIIVKLSSFIDEVFRANRQSVDLKESLAVIVDPPRPVVKFCEWGPPSYSRVEFAEEEKKEEVIALFKPPISDGLHRRPQVN